MLQPCVSGKHVTKVSILTPKAVTLSCVALTFTPGGRSLRASIKRSRRHHVCASLTVSLHGTGGCASCRDGLLT